MEVLRTTFELMNAHAPNRHWHTPLPDRPVHVPAGRREVQPVGEAESE